VLDALGTGDGALVVKDPLGRIAITDGALVVDENVDHRFACRRLAQRGRVRPCDNAGALE